MANKWSAMNLGQAPGAIKAVNDHLIIYVSTTGYDDTGNGSITAPYATPHKAMEHVRGFYIGEEGKVTIKCAAGEYTFTKTLHLNHPQGEKIHLVGDDPLECGHPSNTYNYTVKGAYGVTFGYDETLVGGSHKIKLLMGRPVSGENSGFTTEHGLTKGHVGSWLQVYPITLWNNGNVDPGGQVNLAPTLSRTYGKASLYDREWGSGNTSGGLSDNFGWEVDGTGSPGGSGGMQWRWVCGCSKITAVTGGAARLHHNPQGADAGPQGNDSGSHIEINAQFMSAFIEPRISTGRAAHKRSYYNDPQEYADNVNNQGGVVNSDTTKNIGLISTYSIPTTDGHTAGFVASTPDTIGARVLKTTFKWNGYDEWCAVLITDNKAFGSFKNIVFLASQSSYDNGGISGICIGVDNNSVLSPYSVVNKDDDHIWNNDDHSITSRCAWLNWSRPVDVWYGSKGSFRQCTFGNFSTMISYYDSCMKLHSCVLQNCQSVMTNSHYQSSIYIDNCLMNNAFYQTGLLKYGEDEILPTGAAGWAAGDYIVQFTTEDGNAKFFQQGIIKSVRPTDRTIYFKPIVDVADGDTNPPSLGTNFSNVKRLFLVKPAQWEELKQEVKHGWQWSVYGYDNRTVVDDNDGVGPIHAAADPIEASLVAGAIDGYFLEYRSISPSDGRAGGAGSNSLTMLNRTHICGMGGYGMVGSRNTTLYADQTVFYGIKNHAMHTWMNCGLNMRDSVCLQSRRGLVASNSSNIYSYNNYFTNMGTNTMYLAGAAHGWSGYNSHYIGRDGMGEHVHETHYGSSISIDDDRIYFPLFSEIDLWTRPVDGNKIPTYSSGGGGAKVAPTAAYPCANPNIIHNPYVLDLLGNRSDDGAYFIGNINNNILPLNDGFEPVPEFYGYHSDNTTVGTNAFSVLGDGFIIYDDDEATEAGTEFGSRMDGWTTLIDSTSMTIANNQYGKPYTYRRSGNIPLIHFFN